MEMIFLRWIQLWSLFFICTQSFAGVSFNSQEIFCDEQNKCKHLGTFFISKKGLESLLDDSIKTYKQTIQKQVIDELEGTAQPRQNEIDTVASDKAKLLYDRCLTKDVDLTSNPVKKPKRFMQKTPTGGFILLGSNVENCPSMNMGQVIKEGALQGTSPFTNGCLLYPSLNQDGSFDAKTPLRPFRVVLEDIRVNDFDYEIQPANCHGTNSCSTGVTLNNFKSTAQIAIYLWDEEQKKWEKRPDEADQPVIEVSTQVLADGRAPGFDLSVAFAERNSISSNSTTFGQLTIPPGVTRLDLVMRDEKTGKTLRPSSDNNGPYEQTIDDITATTLATEMANLCVERYQSSSSDYTAAKRFYDKIVSEYATHRLNDRLGPMPPEQEVEFRQALQSFDENCLQAVSDIQNKGFSVNDKELHHAMKNRMTAVNQYVQMQARQGINDAISLNGVQINTSQFSMLNDLKKFRAAIKTGESKAYGFTNPVSRTMFESAIKTMNTDSLNDPEIMQYIEQQAQQVMSQAQCAAQSQISVMSDDLATTIYEPFELPVIQVQRNIQLESMDTRIKDLQKEIAQIQRLKNSDFHRMNEDMAMERGIKGRQQELEKISIKRHQLASKIAEGQSIQMELSYLVDKINDVNRFGVYAGDEQDCRSSMQFDDDTLSDSQALDGADFGLQLSLDTLQAYVDKIYENGDLLCLEYRNEKCSDRMTLPNPPQLIVDNGEIYLDIKDAKLADYSIVEPQLSAKIRLNLEQCNGQSICLNFDKPKTYNESLSVRIFGNATRDMEQALKKVKPIDIGGQLPKVINGSFNFKKPTVRTTDKGTSVVFAMDIKEAQQRLLLPAPTMSLLQP